MKKGNLFNRVQVTTPGSNWFDLRHDFKFSCNMGQLVPIMVMECVPGDRVNVGCQSMLRFAPTVAPFMHRVDTYMHYWFVPNRILWPNWENFITNTPVGGLPVAFPFINIEQANQTSLTDYMGIPPTDNDAVEQISALPFAAYQMIYNEFYRDQNLINPVNFKLSDGNNTLNTDLRVLRKRAWGHDYFTSCLPEAQKGAAVDIPIGDFNDVPVKAQQDDPPTADTGLTIAGTYQPSSTPSVSIQELGDADTEDPLFVGSLYAETSAMESTATSINDLRRAWALQTWLEKAMRAGSRYAETLLSFFGVRSKDSRLDRPEYITGLKTPVTVSEVLNTTGTEEVPQGNMAGHAISVTNGKYGKYTCDEHGYIIGIMSVLPVTAYQQGIEKHFLKINNPFEFYFPEFAHIGEQEVKNREIYAFTLDGDTTFGYIPRFAEYKFLNNRVAGDFRTSLDFWHLGRIFDSQPGLNQEFIEMNSVAADRIFAVTDPNVQKLWIHVFNDVTAVRKMPKYGNPSSL